MFVCYLFVNIFVILYLPLMVLLTVDRVCSAETASAANILTIDATEKWNITAYCKSQQALTGCNFKFWFQDTSGSEIGTTLDLSSVAVANDSNSGKEVRLVTSYSALEGDSKSCSLSLNLTSGEYFFGCRTRAKHTDWVYNFTTLHVDGHGKIQAASYNVELIAPRTNVTIGWSIQEGSKWSQCTYLFPENRSSTTTNAEDNCASMATTHRFCLKGLECYLTLLNVDQEKIAGPIFRYGTVKYKGSDNFTDVLMPVKIIVVEDKPGQHKMSVAFLEENVILQAKSEVIMINSGSTSIRWLIGDQEIERNEVQDNSSWAWPWESQVITQIVRHKLKESDNGKNISCIVTHVYKNKSSVYETTLQLGSAMRSDRNEVGTTFSVTTTLLLAIIIGAVAGVLIFYSRRKEKIFSFVPQVLPPERSTILVDNNLYADHFPGDSGLISMPLVPIGNSQENRGNSRDSFVYSSPECDFEVVDDQQTENEAEYNFYDEPTTVVSDVSTTVAGEEDNNIYHKPWTGLNMTLTFKGARESALYEEILNSPDEIPFFPEV